jgi:hypothetical protein
MACDPRLNRSLVRLPPTLPVDFPPFNPSHPFYAIQTNSTPELVQRSNRGTSRGRPLLRALTATRVKREPQAAAPVAPVAQEERTYVLAEQLDHVSCVPPKPLLRSRSWSVRRTLEVMTRSKTSEGPRITPLSPRELPHSLSKIVDNIGRSLSRRLRKESVSTHPIPIPMSSISSQANSVEKTRLWRYKKIYASPL